MTNWRHIPLAGMRLEPLEAISGVLTLALVVPTQALGVLTRALVALTWPRVVASATRGVPSEALVEANRVRFVATEAPECAFQRADALTLARVVPTWALVVVTQTSVTSPVATGATPQLWGRPPPILANNPES